MKGTVLFAAEGSNMDVGGRVFLRAKGSRAELVSRAITKGGDILICPTRQRSARLQRSALCE